MKPRRVLVSMLAAGALLAVPLTSQAIVLSGGGSTPSLNCLGATASAGTLWPPNKEMVAETIQLPNSTALGVTINITGIEQDQPLETNRWGKAQPDGSGLGTATAYLRAQRAGQGTGRIYFISFQASDLSGSQCTGWVLVYVPRFVGQGYNPYDTGTWYNSI